eukprot:1504364-Prymnesium_polylepis.1
MVQLANDSGAGGVGVGGAPGEPPTWAWEMAVPYVVPAAVGLCWLATRCRARPLKANGAREDPAKELIPEPQASKVDAALAPADEPAA